MIAYAKTDSGEIYTLKDPLLISIQQEENAPADQLILQFARQEDLPELASVILKEDEQVFFTGIIDEQITVYSSNGKIVKLVARSMAALLLDNESEPMEYFHPTDEVMFLKHAKAFLNSYQGKGKKLSKLIQVKKGASHWSVIEDYCKQNYQTLPRVNEEGELLLCGADTDKTLTFGRLSPSNDVLPYTYLSVTNKRCKPISSVFVRMKHNKGYELEIKNPKLHGKSIVRQRYLNVADTQNINAYHADKMISLSNTQTLEIKLTAPVRINKPLGAQVCLQEYMPQKKWRVIKAYYTQTAQGEETQLWLTEAE